MKTARTSEEMQHISGPLTSTGMGRMLQSLSSTDPGIDPHNMMDEVSRHSFLVVRGLALLKETFKEITHSLGQIVHYTQGEGYGFADILELDGSTDEGKFVTGRGPLPLHTDGALLKKRIDFSVLYCAEHSGGALSGATLVCDQRAAIAEMPQHLLGAIRANDIEYLIEEKGYFTTFGREWLAIETIRDYGKGLALNIALPFPKGLPAGWRVRLANVSESESERILDELTEFLNRERYIYVHQWKTGDLIIIDNQYTLHGRWPLDDGSARRIYRAQFTFAY